MLFVGITIFPVKYNDIPLLPPKYRHMHLFEGSEIGHKALGHQTFKGNNRNYIPKNSYKLVKKRFFDHIVLLIIGLEND